MILQVFVLVLLIYFTVYLFILLFLLCFIYLCFACSVMRVMHVQLNMHLNF